MPRSAIVLIALSLALAPVVAQQTPGPADELRVREMRFVDQPITDILLALAAFSGRSMVPDETVAGRASYYFAEMDFQTALALFLETYKLYFRREGSVYYISRIRTEWDPQTQTIAMDAEDVELPLLIRAASRAMGRTVLFDPLPAERLTVHVRDADPERLLAILMRRFSDYTIEADAGTYYVRRQPRPAPETAARQEARRPATGLTREGDLYSADLERVRFRDFLDDLFRLAGLEYSLFLQRDVLVEALRFRDRDFDGLLRLVLEQVGADYTVFNGVYYVYEVQQRDILKKLKTTIRVPLTHLAARDLPNLVPSDLLTSRLYKLDLRANAIILNGSLEEIAPVEEFIRRIDVPLEDREYFVFQLSFVSAKDVKSILPPEFSHSEPIAIPGTSSFAMLIPPERRVRLQQYLELVDRSDAVTPIRLRYIKAEDLLAKLPPSIAKDDVIETADPTTVFVRGTPRRVEAFRRDLRLLDVPVPQIRYQFLVLQYQRGESVTWSDPDSARFQIAPGDHSSILGNIGQLLSLDFDTVDALGYQLAAKLNLDLSNNVARVMADTTLMGTSGQEVRFQNTETFRYREPEVDEDGNVTYTGVTREITAGLIFSVNGWVSGDGMITMEVGATVSKRGVNTSTTTGTLPPTSENVVKTLVRTPSGEPVVIGGLMRQEKTTTIAKVPFLGDIPLLGLLFQSKKDSVENTELVIYIVPHVDPGPRSDLDLGIRLERLYDRFLSRG